MMLQKVRLSRVSAYIKLQRPAPGKRRRITTFPEAASRRWMHVDTQLHKGMKTRYKKIDRVGLYQQ